MAEGKPAEGEKPRSASGSEKKKAAPREQPWAVRGVSQEARGAAAVAARKAGLSLGAWLDRVVKAAAVSEIGGPVSPAGAALEALIAELSEAVSGLTAKLTQLEQQPQRHTEAVPNPKFLGRILGSTTRKPGG